MAPRPAPATKGKKRSRNGKEKPQAVPDTKPTSQRTPTCAQAPSGPNNTSSSATEPQSTTSAAVPDDPKFALLAHKKARHSHARRKQKQKLPRLPDNYKISKRPLLHPAVPTPFANAASPKTIYLKPSSPFIPAIKRIRNLLSQIDKRKQQALSALRASGRLKGGEVEGAIARGVVDAGRGEAEAVYVKAAGRAIERALRVGVWFQEEERDCCVRVEMGSVGAVDDIEMDVGLGDAGAKDKVEGVRDGDGDGGMEDVEATAGASGGKEKGKRKRKVMAEEDVPETRIRMLSAVTVIITLKQ